MARLLLQLTGESVAGSPCGCNGKRVKKNQEKMDESIPKMAIGDIVSPSSRESAWIFPAYLFKKIGLFIGC